MSGVASKYAMVLPSRGALVTLVLRCVPSFSAVAATEPVARAGAAESLQIIILERSQA